MDHSLLGALSPSDRELFFKFGFGPIEPQDTFSFGCVHHAFMHHASVQPNAIAVEHGTATITYASLDAKSNRLARRLRHSGVVPGARVCILGSRGIPLIVGILGVIKAGGQYVPLDGGIVTDSTLAFVLDNSECTIALTLKKFETRLPEAIDRVVLEDYLKEDVEGDYSAVEDMSLPSHGLYVIYTSGTTGKPKGVSISHLNVTNLVLTYPGNVGMKPGSRVAQLLNIAFDMAAWEMLGSLANGATLVVRADDWKSVMAQVDTVISTPTILQSYPPAKFPNVKYLATAGEPCPQDLADSWAAAGAAFHNSCGPTETTIVNTMVRHVAGTRLSIGRPTRNNTVYILDEDLHPVPIGEPGTLWAGGLGISEGYVNLPVLNRERFKHDVYRGEGIMFNTGDLGRWNEDGTIEHLGRADDQVKIKGFRVELDGVKSAMETAKGVVTAAALKVGNDLVGFFSPAYISEEDVKAAASKILPYYAVPKICFPLQEFPRTANGKIDKRALKAHAETQAASTKISVPSPLSDISNTRAETVVPLALALAAPATLPPVYVLPRVGSGSIASSSSSTKEGSSRPDTLNEKDKVSRESSVVKLSEVEKGNYWDGYQEDEIPEKTQGKWVRNARHQIFTLYRRMFGVVFIVNIGLLIGYLATGGLQSPQIGKIVVGNLMGAILMRQDHVVNAFFAVFCAVPRSWPLAIRRVCARVYHIGGLHSGCSISGTMWFIYFTVQLTIDFTKHKIGAATLVITYVVIVILVLIIFFAYPRTRIMKHDTFEKTHRFAGWTATGLLWAHTVCFTNDIKGDISLARALRTSSSFWMVVILTGSIILPWLKLRKVNVRSEVLSNHAIRLYFDYVTPTAGSYTRISRDPLTEWHSFATIAEPGKSGYSLVVSRAGDWTGKTIAEPPTRLWVRGVPTMGVMRIAPLFNRLVIVATGSGIGPCTPVILAKRIPIRVLWTAPDVRKTFGDKYVDDLLEANPEAVIYDTRKYGKPDMIKLTYRMVKEFNAEAVCVISNQSLTRKVVYGMVSRGIPAFGAIWDS